MFVINVFSASRTARVRAISGIELALKHYGVNYNLLTGLVKSKDHVINFTNYRNLLRQFEKSGSNIVVCDYPLLLGNIYGRHKPAAFYALARAEFERYQNLNLFIPKGKQARKIDLEISCELSQYRFISTKVEGVAQIVMEELYNEAN